MSIEKFYTTTFIVSRQIWVAKKSSLVEQGTFDGHLQQGSPENLQESLGFRFTKAFTIWCAVGTDVTEGDRLVNGSDKYDIHFIIDRNVGSNNHLQLVVEKIDG